MISILIAGLVGCASSSDPMAPPTTNPPPVTPPPTNPDPVPDIYLLSIVGWQNITADQGQQITLQVRYTKNSQSAPNEVVSFKMVGDSKDSVLSTYTATTNLQGFAETVLTAGQILGQFKIEARTGRTQPVTWDIKVQKKPVVTPKAPVLAGSFTLQNKFDIQGQFTGSKLAKVLTLLNEISNDPNDPGKFVVDAVLKKVNNQAVLTVATLLKPVLDKEVNKLLTSIAPKFIGQIKQLAADLSTITHRFEISSTLSTPIPQDGDRPMQVDHQLDAIAWEMSGQRVVYTFTQLGMKPPVVNGIVMNPTNTTDMVIAQHQFELKFGSFVLVALNNLVIPRIQKGAKSFNDLLKANIDCAKVGTTMNKTVGIGGQALWQGACDAGLMVVGAMIEGEITGMDKEQSKLVIAGQTKLLDNNNDGFFDAMQQGTWKGTFTLSKATAVIAGQGNTFAGTRTK